MYYLFYITKYVHVIHTLASHLQDNRETGVSQGSMSQSRQGTPSVTATCLVWFELVTRSQRGTMSLKVENEGPSILRKRFAVCYPAGAAAGSCFLLVTLPAQPQGTVSYSFLLSSSSSSSFFFFFLPCRRSRRVLFLTRFFFLLLLLLLLSSSFFFFFLLATHLFHTLPYIWFWPNLLTVTGTLTTTHTLKMVGSGVTMGSLGSKRSFSPKTHQVLQIT